MKAKLEKHFEKLKTHKNNQKFWVALVAFVVVLLLGFLGYKYFAFSQQIENLESTLGDRESKISELEETIQYYQVHANDLSQALSAEQTKNSLFEDQINAIAGTVGDLDKLRKLDEELLYKYSKVYFLNEHYVPSGLSGIDLDYVYNKNKAQHVLTQVRPFLEDLISRAERDRIDLKVFSSYRPFGEQGSIKSNYTIVYGTGANQFSADQGYSEHQLGTTVDFTTPETGENLDAFGNTKAFEWLEQNAHKYGFTLSYPAGNAYYQFEPWHWRFVGVKLATRLHRENKHFYDLEQREINEYLISIFD